jgi:MFS family permease
MMSREHRRPNSVLALLVGDFALLGVVVGAQGVLWTALLTALRITKSAFGTAQLTSPFMAVLLLLLGGHLSVMIGKKRMAALSLFLLGVASLILGAAGTFWGFLMALLVQGVGYGLFETAKRPVSSTLSAPVQFAAGDTIPSQELRSAT